MVNRNHNLVTTILYSDEHCNKIIIEYDCDGNYDEITEQINHILGEESKEHVSFLEIKFEIEEWICNSLDIKYNDNRRPAKALKDFERKNGLEYTKDKLPSYWNMHSSFDIIL